MGSLILRRNCRHPRARQRIINSRRSISAADRLKLRLLVVAVPVAFRRPRLEQTSANRYNAMTSLGVFHDGAI